jgi:S1-C subfamily serine protease
MRSQEKRGIPRRGIPRYILVVLLPVLALACRVTIPSNAPAEPVEVIRTVVVTVEAAAAQDIELAQPVAPLTITEDSEPLVELYARVNPAVVNITIYTEQNTQTIPASQGSGFVFDGDGHIVTNAHVVHGATDVEVTFADGTGRLAEIVGEDLNSDLAVVKVESLPEGVRSLPLGNMGELAVGQTVVAIGNPFGLEGTLTRGVISSLGRTIPALTVFSIPQSIQTDAAINPGNSGGPLLNMRGEVIGVNAQIETDGLTRSNLGVGFAIPVSIVREVVPDLIQSGEHKWSWLGVQGGDVTPLLVEAMDLPVEQGAYISNVISDGPSAKAGLRGVDDTRTIRGRQADVGGDVIVAVNDQPVNNFDDLLVYVALQTDPGDDVTLKIVRDGEFRDLVVKLEERPASVNILPQP